MNKGIHSLWSNPVIINSINNKEILENFTSSIFENSNLDMPFSEMQDTCIFENGPETFKQFRDEIVLPAFEEYLDSIGIDKNKFPKRKVKSWITGSKKGYMISPHNHSGASLSGIFYILNEEKNKGGELVLQDPRNNANRGYKEEFKFLFEDKKYMPSSGEYIIFPSYIYHYTLPFNGALRLAVPVDLFL
jgi:hypothetical protein